MESSDLKWLKKHFGEKFSRLCRDLFPSILENEGQLKEILLQHFIPNRELYNDIVNNNLIDEFANYVSSLVDASTKTQVSQKSPEDLMDEAGYILYPECKTEEDIQKFRHYYYRGKPTPKYEGGKPEKYQGEELCTFNGGRLNTCRVWFAVKKDVNKIKRENFKNPRREDDYGVSVISIQFAKTNPSRLSIKNRYNHSIKGVNPDATYSNNLDNIIIGLTKAFTDKYNIYLTTEKGIDFEIPNYIKAIDDRYYKYNLEVNDIYYCPNNLIIEQGKPKILDKERYLLFDYYVLDNKEKMIKNYYDFVYNNDSSEDSFIKSIGEIKEIKRISNENGTTIQIMPATGDIVEIGLNKHNEIISYKNSNVISIKDDFLYYNKVLEYLELPNVVSIGKCFLYYNETLKHLECLNTKYIGSFFLGDNIILQHLELPNVESIGNYFLTYNRTLEHLELPNVESIRNYFLTYNRTLEHLELAKVVSIGDYFLFWNNKLKHIHLPNVKSIGNYFLNCNDYINKKKILLNNNAKSIKNSFSLFNRFKHRKKYLTNKNEKQL